MNLKNEIGCGREIKLGRYLQRNRVNKCLRKIFLKNTPINEAFYYKKKAQTCDQLKNFL